MKIRQTSIVGLVEIEPRIHKDTRGYFFESFNQRDLCNALGFEVNFVQDNQSYSGKHVMRGLHYQVEIPQAKLIRVVSGAIFDVCVDLRENSSTFGQWYGTVLSAENFKQLWIPRGFAHGFQVVSDYAEIIYKTDNYWSPEHEKILFWNDQSLGINWPEMNSPIINNKDQNGLSLQSVNPIKIS